MTNPVQLSKKELNKVFWRSYQALGCYTYDKQQGISYMRALLPALQKLYPDPEDLKEALIRHNVMFNTTCAFVPFCLGITCAMEEEYANAPEGTFDPQSISSVKIALMGPLAGIGDSFFWGTFRVIGVGVGAPLAVAGNILGPILYFLINFIPSEIVRRVGFKIGYEGGSEFLTRISEDGTLNKLTEAARIMGLVVIGAMMASMVNVNLVTVLNINGAQVVLQEIFDAICPKILPLGLTFACYWGLQKRYSGTVIMIALLVLGVLAVALGLL